jgi:nucleoside-diphosphate-sugar epimerase
VDDVVSALISALQKTGLEGKSFNLVGDVRLSVAEYIAALRGISQRDIRVHRQSILKWTTIEFMKWAVKAIAGKPNNSRLSYHEFAYRSLASPFDCTLAKQVLGWNPVSDRERFIELGIRRTVPDPATGPAPVA